MNYSTRGIHKRIAALNSKTEKMKKMFLVTLLKIVLVCIVAVGIFGLSTGLGLFKGIIASVPEVSLDDLMPNGYATMVYDSDGNPIQKLVAEASNRTYVQMEMIPENLAHAFVAIEDARYYEHNGIDIKSILRAGIRGITNGFHFDQGASTITQQLLKNNVFTDWMSEDSFFDSVQRKLQEQYLAIEVTKKYDKDTLLCLYMNTINLGSNTLGVQAASMKYFGKNVQDLTLSECAVIAGITQNPSKYNPILHPEENKERRKLVLGEMLKFEFITQEEYDDAMLDTDEVYSRINTVNVETQSSSVYSYFIDALTEQLTAELIELGKTPSEAYNILFCSGYRIQSTMDSRIQAICDAYCADESNYPEKSKWYLSEYRLTVKKADGSYSNYSVQMLESYFKSQSKEYNRIYTTQEEATADIEEYVASILEEGDEVYDEVVSMTPQPQISLVVEDQKTGAIVAMVGGRGVKTASKTLNRATNTSRQPGSTFKVVSVYAPALDSYGMTLASVQTDAPFCYNDGTPVSNWWTGGTYKGICSVRYAIEQSLNIIAVKNLTVITPQLGFEYLQQFGFTTLVEGEYINGEYKTDITQSLGLGGITYGVTNLELNAAYATIANGGTYVEPYLYTQLIAPDGTVVIDHTVPEARQVIKPTTAYLLTSAMMDVVSKGTGTLARFDNMAIAGKTGTTSKNNDIWFAGYTPYYTCTIWAGYDNNVSMNSNDEKSFHKKLWKKIMQEIHADLPYKNFTIPSNIVTCTVCSKSGKLPIAGLCDDCLVTEYFEAGTEPTETCNVHFSGWVCATDLLPATEDCPFSVPGVVTVDPPLDPSLVQGSTVLGKDGSVVSAPSTTGYCRHTYEFFLDPMSGQTIQEQFAALSADMQAAVRQYHTDIWGY